MAITIDREQRDAIYEEILTELTGSGDVCAEMAAGNYDAARCTRDRLLGDMPCWTTSAGNPTRAANCSS